ncbi:hypothetical protein ACH4SK_05260 [Streptomyces inhibens]|uniref:hypothetical protein n=1 Tax=Streptomyces inhibens TaxID=2293571 RepID=UPI00378A8DC9
MDGLFVLGSTGEAACLSDIQRRTVIETVVAAPQLPLDAAAHRTVSRLLEEAGLL